MQNVWKPWGQQAVPVENKFNSWCLPGNIRWNPVALFFPCHLWKLLDFVFESTEMQISTSTGKIFHAGEKLENDFAPFEKYSLYTPEMGKRVTLPPLKNILCMPLPKPMVIYDISQLLYDWKVIAHLYNISISILHIARLIHYG